MYGTPGPHARRKMAEAWGAIILREVRARRIAKTKRFAIVAGAVVLVAAIAAGAWYAIAA